MKVLIHVVTVLSLSSCFHFWAADLDKSSTNLVHALRDNFKTSENALDALQMALEDEEQVAGALIECCHKLIRMMGMDKFPIGKAIAILDSIMARIFNEENRHELSKRMAEALHSHRQFMPISAFVALLQRPILAAALRADPKWWRPHTHLSIPVIMAMLHIGCRIDQENLVQSIGYDTNLYWHKFITHNYVLSPHSALFILYLPHKLDWTTVTGLMGDDQDRLKTELIDVLAVRKRVESLVVNYAEFTRCDCGLPLELLHEIRGMLLTAIQAEYAPIIQQYQNVSAITMF